MLVTCARCVKIQRKSVSEENSSANPPAFRVLCGASTSWTTSQWHPNAEGIVRPGRTGHVFCFDVDAVISSLVRTLISKAPSSSFERAHTPRAQRSTLYRKSGARLDAQSRVAAMGVLRSILIPLYACKLAYAASPPVKVSLRSSWVAPHPLVEILCVSVLSAPARELTDRSGRLSRKRIKMHTFPSSMR